MYFFGGKVYKKAPFISSDASVPNTYSLLNFNDLISAYYVMFSLMVVNNWQFIVTMYVDACGTILVRFFFGLFFYFAVVIGINITVAFVLDMYGSVERLDADRN